ncbi:MAG TPA: M48 family metallopeptidase [Allosphingosinicella sp.]|nr:M48 family metallopeptidase [Allosphingosinicella sp.]
MKTIFIRPFSCPSHKVAEVRERARPRRPALRFAILLPILSLGFGAAGAGAQPAPVASTAVDSATSTTLRRDDLRVALVAYRLALAGTALCTERHPLTGMLFHHLAEYEPGDRPLMVARYGLDRGPGVLTVLSDSPAARAGLIAGDVLLAVNGRPLPTGTSVAAEPKREKWRRLTDESEAELETALRRGPAELRVLREGREVALRLGSLPACLGRVRLARSTQVNAFATGRTVVMTTAMLKFIRGDGELAVVLGHELAHNIFGHRQMRNEEGILRGLGLKPSAVWKREEAADRFGLRLMSAAGYDLDAAIPFWRRYLGKYDWFPQIFRSHPSLGARERIAAEEIAAIRREKAGL